MKNINKLIISIPSIVIMFGLVGCGAAGESESSITKYAWAGMKDRLRAIEIASSKSAYATNCDVSFSNIKSEILRKGTVPPSAIKDTVSTDRIPAYVVKFNFITTINGCGSHSDGIRNGEVEIFSISSPVNDMVYTSRFSGDAQSKQDELNRNGFK